MRSPARSPRPTARWPPRSCNLLELLRQRLNVDRLVAAAIERATYARYAVALSDGGRDRLAVLGAAARSCTIAQMAAADAAAIAAGIRRHRADGERRRRRQPRRSSARFAALPTVVLCGPGNNGGDGFVVARRLARAGWPVRVALLGAARAPARRCRPRPRRPGPATTVPLEPAVLEGAGLVVDALFGAGLARPLDGVARATIEAVRAAAAAGRRGRRALRASTATPARSWVPPRRAALTVTFHRAKPGHLLLPGRELCRRAGGRRHRHSRPRARRRSASGLGPTSRGCGGRCCRGAPPASHKYSHGHALVLGGGTASSGAARMAARAALRAGAGLVTVRLPRGRARDLRGAADRGHGQRPSPIEPGFARELEDPRRNAILLGPGAGVGEALRRRVLAALASGKACVLDADALTSFAGQPRAPVRGDRGPCLLTPHEGEFRRLFDHAGDKLDAGARGRCRRAARSCCSKARDTVVAAPDGRAIVQPDAPPTLATAGSGDVLAGIALGLLAQGMPVFEAAAAAVWLHAQAAARWRPGHDRRGSDRGCCRRRSPARALSRDQTQRRKIVARLRAVVYS